MEPFNNLNGFPELLDVLKCEKKGEKDKLKNEELKKCCMITFSFIQEC